MKRILTLLSVFSLTLILSACNKEEGYYEGTFTGKSDQWEFGWEEADVKFVDDQIVDIELKRIWVDGKEVNYDLFDGTNPDGKPNLKQYRIDLANRMLEADDPTDVDAVAGATISSEGWIQAVERAIEKAKK